MVDFLEGKLPLSIEMQRTDARRLLNTVDDTTKGLPILGGITSPLLKTVGGVTDGLPIVCYPSPLPIPRRHANVCAISSVLPEVKAKHNNNNLCNSINMHNPLNTRLWLHTSLRRRNQC